MKSLRICFVTQEFPEETGWGGIGTYVHQMAKGLVAQGHHVAVLSRAIAQPSDLVVDGVRVVRILPKGDFRKVPLLWRIHKVWEGYRLAVGLELPKLIRREDIDLVEAQDLHGEIALNVFLNNLHVPYVCRLENSLKGFKRRAAYQPNPFILWKSICCEKVVVAKAQSISAPSHSIIEESQGHLLLQGKKIRVIPNPVDCQVFQPPQAATSEDLGILFSGRLVGYKGVHFLPGIIAGVLKKQADAHFTVVGNVHEPYGGSTLSGKDWILSQIPAPMHSRVHFFSWASHASMVSYYQGCRMVIVPSLCESFGNCAAEALACGKPVVAHAVGGLNEILAGDQMGVRVPTGQIDVFVDAIVALWRDPSRCQEMGRRGRQRALALYDIPAVTQQMVDFYRSNVKA